MMIISSNDTILTNGDGRKIFGDATALRDDYSLCALLRALVLKNESHEDLYALADKTKIYCDDKYGVSDVEDVMEDVDCPICIIEYGSDWEEASDICEEATNRGWETFDNPPYYLNRYLSQIVPTKVFIHREDKRVLAVVKDGIKLKWVRAFCSLLWVVFPWYFPEDKKDDFIPFFKAISVDNKDISEEEAKRVFVEYVNSAAAGIDLRAIGTRRLLQGIADVTRIAQINAARSSISELERMITDATTRLRNAYSQLDDNKTILKGLEMLDPQKDDEVFEFFETHKNVSVESRSGSDLVYSVTDTLEFFDKAELKTILENEYSWAREFRDQDIKWIKTLLLEERGIVRVNAAFNLKNMSLVSPRRGDWRERDAMPNPHIYYHACSGGNDQYYSEYAKKGEWQLAIEQSISATKNWAPGDSTVSKELFRWLIENENVKCVFVTDGSPLEEVTPDCKLVTIGEYKNIVKKKIEDEKAQKESEEATNG